MPSFCNKSPPLPTVTSVTIEAFYCRHHCLCRRQLQSNSSPSDTYSANLVHIDLKSKPQYFQPRCSAFTLQKSTPYLHLLYQPLLLSPPSTTTNVKTTSHTATPRSKPPHHQLPCLQFSLSLPLPTLPNIAYICRLVFIFYMVQICECVLYKSVCEYYSFCVRIYMWLWLFIK